MLPGATDEPGEPHEDHFGPNEYLVRLLFDVTASSPGQAVREVIKTLVNNGLTVWTYRAFHKNTGTSTLCNGLGEVIDDEVKEGWDEAHP